MASDDRDNSTGRGRPAIQSIPGVEIITTASQHAQRKMEAVQRTPIGRRVLDVVRNLMWVVPLTMLVWLYAERQQMDDQAIRVTVAVRPDRSDRVVALASGTEKTLSIQVRATKARIQQLRDDLGKQQGLQIVVPAQLGLGTEVLLSTLEAVSANPAFADRGIAVTSCTPSTLILQIDEQVTVEVHPELPREIAQRLEGPAVLEPPTVSLTGPKRALTGASPAEVVAEITQQMLPKVSGEIPVVPLKLRAENELVTISPAQVKARVKLKASAVEYTIPVVPVFTYGPPALFDKYIVRFPTGPFLSHVTVTGPQDEINKIINEEFKPRALLEVQQQDVRERLPRSPSSYILPPNVSVVEKDRNRTVAFELVERTRTE